MFLWKQVLIDNARTVSMKNLKNKRMPARTNEKIFSNFNLKLALAD